MNFSIYLQFNLYITYVYIFVYWYYDKIILFSLLSYFSLIRNNGKIIKVMICIIVHKYILKKLTIIYF